MQIPGLTNYTFDNSCLEDVDDEVRDRAALYLKTLKYEQLAETYVKEGWWYFRS